MDNKNIRGVRPRGKKKKGKNDLIFTLTEL